MFDHIHDGVASVDFLPYDFVAYSVFLLTKYTYSFVCNVVIFITESGVRSVASLVGQGEGRPPRVTPSRGVTPDLKLFLSWLNLERTLDKRRGKMGLVRRRQLKKMTKKVIRFF